MAKKRLLDQFLVSRRSSQDIVLAGRTQLANRVFRLSVAVILTFALVLLTRMPDVTYTIGLALFLLILTLLGGICLHRLQPGVFDRPASFNKFVLLVVLTMGCHEFFLFIGWSPLLLPLPLFAMILSLAHSQLLALLSTLAVGFILGLTSPRARLLPHVAGTHQEGLPLLLRMDMPLVLTLTLGSVAALLCMRRVREQSKPVVVGLVAGVVQALLVLGFGLMRPGMRLRSLTELDVLSPLLKDCGWAFGGGLLSGAILTCLLPHWERFFDFLTERRLLSLADPSNTLLRLVRERAPGTYQHTLNVAHLAGNAAEAIGADRLLAEVGAYYHDVGKIHKPEYFVENMGENKTIHDRLRPSMSKLIIIAHVKEGIILARDAGLPQKVIDMIPMHHGTTVVEYFYQKAKRDGAAGSTPVETEYRYPGPRPRFREAGVLMLADMVEAIAKTESDPSPMRFRTMVHEQILKRLLDGQLDESDLTLNDLRVIEDSFVRTLTNMYHSRIKYPTQPAPEKPGARSREDSTLPPEGRVRVGGPASGVGAGASGLP